MKIRPVGPGLIHADGQTDMTNLAVAFRSFAKAPGYNLQRRGHGPHFSQINCVVLCIVFV